MIDHRLHTFLTVCKYMNYTKAAQELFITQPAVSQHIRYLEKYYGVSLFSSSGKTLTLTPAGRLLLQKASAMKNDEILLKQSLLTADTGTFSYHFGVTTTIGEFVIARPLARFLRDNPKTGIQMTMANTEELLEGLRRGDYHFALVEGYFPRDEFAFRVFSTEDFVAVCSASHVFAGTPSETPSLQAQPSRMKDLLSEPLLLRESGSGTRDILEKALDLNNISLSSFSRITEINSMYAIVQLLLADCGISFLYKTAVLPYLRTGQLRVIPLEDFHPRHDFAFLWQKGSVYGSEYEKIFGQLQTGRDATF